MPKLQMRKLMLRDSNLPRAAELGLTQTRKIPEGGLLRPQVLHGAPARELRGTTCP